VTLRILLCRIKLNSAGEFDERDVIQTTDDRLHYDTGSRAYYS